MVRTLALGLAALALVSTAASAHGPSRQKVTETVEINAPADKVWTVIGNFQDMSWHPAVAKLEGAGGNDANATRTLTLTSGGTIAESVRALRRAGARPTFAVAATHGLLLDGACERMAAAGVERVYVTDSVDGPERRCGHTEVVTIAPLVVATIRLQLC